MDFLQLVKERQTIRKYQQRPVEEEKIQAILEAGRIAPTAANKQPQRFLIVQSPEGLKELSKTANLHGAPLAIVICGLKDKVWQRSFDKYTTLDIDTTIATDHMMLEAWSRGIASCWICYFDPKVVKESFNLPDYVEPVNILSLGYAAEPLQPADRHSSKRMSLDTFIWREKFEG